MAGVVRVFPKDIKELIFDAHKFNVDAHNGSERKARRSREVSKVLGLCNNDIQYEIFLARQASFLQTCFFYRLL